MESENLRTGSLSSLIPLLLPRRPGAVSDIRDAENCRTPRTHPLIRSPSGREPGPHRNLLASPQVSTEISPGTPASWHHAPLSTAPHALTICLTPAAGAKIRATTPHVYMYGRVGLWFCGAQHATKEQVPTTRGKSCEYYCIVSRVPAACGRARACKRAWPSYCIPDSKKQPASFGENVRGKVGKSRACARVAEIITTFGTRSIRRGQSVS